jgi:hypothetical protein
MRIVIIVLSFIVVLFGIIGFVKYSTFFQIDKCLDSGGSWNYETGKCEYETQVEIKKNNLGLNGTKWYSKGLYNLPGDTLTFTSQSNVEYFLGELSWTFDSQYEIKHDTLTIETITSSFEVNDVSGLKPDLKQKYLVTTDFLKLIYLGNLRENKWIEATQERYKNISDFRKYE